MKYIFVSVGINACCAKKQLIQCLWKTLGTTYFECLFSEGSL